MSLLGRRVRKHANPFQVREDLGVLNRQEVFGRVAPVEVDIGCGGGNFLLERAANVRDVDFVERPFTSFWGVAEETADSRFFGGIHTPQDNRVGLEEGKRIATHVTQLKWRKED